MGGIENFERGSRVGKAEKSPGPSVVVWVAPIVMIVTA